MFKHAYAELNGVRLHYVTAGEGKLILFVHGFPEFWYAWRNQLAEFARDYLAVAPEGSHWVIHERSDLVNAHIRNFIS
jgi:pimeloyl-ACP methyl ester carboxylesterase